VNGFICYRVIAKMTIVFVTRVCFGSQLNQLEVCWLGVVCLQVVEELLENKYSAIACTALHNADFNTNTTAKTKRSRT
jgi:hypothetical protein